MNDEIALETQLGRVAGARLLLLLLLRNLELAVGARLAVLALLVGPQVLLLLVAVVVVVAVVVLLAEQAAARERGCGWMLAGERIQSG